jgi:type II secretory pathway pseudopilin PulG
MTPLIVAVLLGLSGTTLVALLYRHNAAINKHVAIKEQQRADAAEAVIHNRLRLDESLENLHITHREETIHANAPENRALRADFDNNWANDSRLHSAGTGSDHAASSTVADSTGTASHHVSRTDVSE